MQPLTFDRVLGRAVISPFREVCSSAAVYSLLVSAFGQLSEAAACLSTATARLAQVARVEEGSVLEDDAHARGTHAERQAASASVQHNDCVFFQALHANPGLQKVVAPATGAGRRLRNTDMMISLHRVLRQDGDNLVVSLEPHRSPSQSAVHVVSALEMHGKLLAKAFLRWGEWGCAPVQHPWRR